MMSLLMSLAQASLPVDAPPIMGRFGLDFMSFLVANGEGWVSRLGDSNPGPMVYKTIALPLS
jgi:hypothetical protein